MKQALVRWTVAVALAGGSAAPWVLAEEGQKSLPTLLIKGEVVSVEASDPAATLLKVKDRYGFETPIYLTPETKIRQGDQTLAAADLTAGAAVEVEYNFDINTAKRQALNVNVSASPPAAAEAPPAAAPAETPAPEAESVPAPASSEAPAAESAPAPAAPAAETPAEPAPSESQEQPAATPATP